MIEPFPCFTETSSLPLLSSMCRVRRVRNFRVQGLTASRTMLCLILQGKGIIILDDIVYTVQPGQLFVLKPGTRIEAASYSDVTEFIMLSMDNVHMQRVRGQWKTSASVASPLDWQTGSMLIRSEEQLESRFKQLYMAYRGDYQPDHFISIHSQLHELLHFISEHRLEANLEKVDPALERSIMYMRRFMSEGISMDHLAKIAGLTPSSYSRSFKKNKGMSPTDYLNRLRIEEAKKQLTEDNCNLKDVASSVGYGNEYYFSRKFKQLLGISPSIYMKKNQLRVATVSLTGFHENLCSLGLTPVAVMRVSPERETDVHEQERHITQQLDQIRRSKPDLIIVDSYHTPYVDHLKSIAATVVLKHTADWKETHLLLAELIGREKQAMLNFKELALRCLEVAEQLQEHFGQKRIAWMELTNQRIRLPILDEHPLNHLLYEELGLTPSSIRKSESTRNENSADHLPLLETDVLLIHRKAIQPSSEKAFRRLKQTAMWNRSPAVQQGNIHTILDWPQLSWNPVGRLQIINELQQIACQSNTLAHSNRNWIVQ